MLGRKARLLDVGCGDGSFASLFLGHASVTGIETQPEDVLAARRRGIRVHCDRLDGAFAARESGRYDLLLCSQVLEHQANPRQFIALLRKLLKPTGLAFLEVPSFDRIKASQAAHSIIPEHLGYYTAGTFAWALDRHFSVLSVSEGFRGQFLKAIVRNDHVSENRFSRAHGSWLRKIEREIRCCGAAGVIMWGAGTRGMALMAMSRVAREGLLAVVDSDPRKQGLPVPGTRLSVSSPASLPALRPGGVLISAVTYRPAIERELRRRGFTGRIILTESP